MCILNSALAVFVFIWDLKGGGTFFFIIIFNFVYLHDCYYYMFIHLFIYSLTLLSSCMCLL